MRLFSVDELLTFPLAMLCLAGKGPRFDADQPLR